MDVLSDAGRDPGVAAPSESGERELGPDDWELFRRVRLAALAQAPEAFSSTHADWVDAPETRWRTRLASVPLNLVLVSAGEPVGLVGGTKPVDGVVELISLWIAPTARGRGLGERAVRLVRDWARSQGAVSLRLNVRTANTSARRLYERLGFTLVGPSPDDPTEVIMTLDLTPTP